MKNLGKKITLLGNIMLLLSSKKIYGFEMVDRTPSNEYTGTDLIPVIKNIEIAAIASFTILIVLILLMFEERLNMERKTRRLIYKILMIISLFIILIITINGINNLL